MIDVILMLIVIGLVILAAKKSLSQMHKGGCAGCSACSGGCCSCHPKDEKHIEHGHRI